MSDELTAGIGAALLALLGVLLTLRWNQQTHESNLAEERRKQREEREFLAKQDALMRVSDAVVRFVTFFVSIPDRELDQGGKIPAEVVDLSVALNRLHFYCGIEAVEGVVKLSRTLNLAFTEVMKARIPSGIIAGDLSALDIAISSLESMNQRTHQEVLVLLGSDPAGSQLGSRWERLAEGYDKLSDLHDKRANLIKDKYFATEACRDVVISQLPEVFQLLSSVLVLAREELGFSIDRDRYANLMNDHSEKMATVLKDLMATVRREAKEQIDS
jgi:hypothetical protein